MVTDDLERTARSLVAEGKGILAADETPRTLTKRFDALKIPSTPESRRAFREMLLTTPGAGRAISGVILQDETIHQKSPAGTPMAALAAQQGMIPGIKVDAGAKPLAGWPDETVTEGLDGLRDRLGSYRSMGARFAKWRAVIRIGDHRPSAACVRANAHALARYAALCQEQGLLPIVEPEVLMNGAHTLERSEEVTGAALRAVFNALAEQGVSLEGMLLKPSMVIAGEGHPDPAPAGQVAAATRRCLRRFVPAAVPGIVFLSGGQDHVTATRHLNAIVQQPGPTPWKISFSYGRALQDEALRAWMGNDQAREAGQRAFAHRARCVGAAALAKYSEAMEEAVAA